VRRGEGRNGNAQGGMKDEAVRASVASEYCAWL
jgi:hypothetical protein